MCLEFKMLQGRDIGSDREGFWITGDVLYFLSGDYISVFSLIICELYTQDAVLFCVYIIREQNCLPKKESHILRVIQIGSETKNGQM